MAVHKYRPVRGLRFWWKDRSPYIWIEMGKRKANAFCRNNRIGKLFLLLIPQPWGSVAIGLASGILGQIKKNKGKKGLWVKFGPQGYVKSKKRTDRNMKKKPSPW